MINEKTIDCKWEEYYVQEPFIDEGMAYLDKTWTLLPEFCIENNYDSIHT